MNAMNWLSTSLKTVQEIYSKAVSEGMSPEEAAALASKAFREMAQDAGMPEALVQQWLTMLQVENLEASVDELIEELGAGVDAAVEGSSLTTALLSQSILALEEEALESSRQESSDSAENVETTAAEQTNLSKARGEAVSEINLVEGSAGLTEDLTADSESDLLSYENETGTEGRGVIVDLGLGLAADAQGAIDNISGFKDVRGSTGDDFIAGDNQDNVLEGLSGADTLVGGDGDDYLIADTSDSIEGGAGYDTLDLSDSVLVGSENFGDAEFLVGSEGNDLIDADGGELDGLYAGDGDDEIIGSQLISNVDGGEGFDIVDVELSGATTIDLDSLNYSSVDQLIIESGDLTLSGSLEDVNVFTGSGDDLIQAGVGYDFIAAGGGNDSLSGGDGADTLLGESGDDSIDGEQGSDVLFGDAGDDTIMGGAGDDTIFGDVGYASSSSMGADYISGGEGNDLLMGEDGDDTLEGNGGDVLSGGDGDDLLLADDATDSVSGGAGMDTLTYTSEGVNVDLSGINDIEYLNGSSGGDDLSGLSGFSAVMGGAGNDTIEYADGVSVDGGEGDDLLDGSNAASAMTGSEPFSNIESIVGSEYSDSIEASDVEYISGGGGDDYFALSGINGIVIDGGEGNDMLDGSDDTDGFSIDFNEGNVLGMETLLGGSGDDTITADDGESPNSMLIDGGDGSDLLIGGNGDDTILGGAGDDTLEAVDGAYSVDAGAGDDSLTFRGGESPEYLHGGEGEDTLTIYEGGDSNLYYGSGIETVILDADMNNDDTLQLHSGEGQYVVFGGGNDSLSGGSGDDTFEGSLDDMENFVRLDGNGGDDLLILDVGEGESSFDGYDLLDDVEELDLSGDASHLSMTLNGSDVTDIDASALTGDVNMSLSGSSSEGVTYIGGSGNDSVDINNDYGADGADLLYGGEGDDVLRGGYGSDFISGGAGNDELDGEYGDDYLAFDDGIGLYDGASGSDTIMMDDSEGMDARLAIDGYDNFSIVDADAVGAPSNSIFDVEGVWFGGGNDTIEIDTSSESSLDSSLTLSGGGGDDLFIVNGEGLDNFYFEGSRDTLIDGSDGADVMDGADLLVGDSGDNFILGGDGSDKIIGGAGADTIDPGKWGAEIISGGTESEELTGGEGADVFHFDMGVYQRTWNNEGTTTTTAEFQMFDNGYVNITDFTIGEDVLLFDDYTGVITGDSFESGDAELMSDGDDIVLYMGDDSTLVLTLEGLGNQGIESFEDMFEMNMISMARSGYSIDGGTSFITGGDGNDYLVGTSGADVIDRSSLGASPEGFIAEDDTVTGGEGADIFNIDVLDFTGDLTGRKVPFSSLAYPLENGSLTITDFTVGEDVLVLNDISGFSDDLETLESSLDIVVMNDGENLEIGLSDGSDNVRSVDGLDPLDGNDPISMDGSDNLDADFKVVLQGLGDEGYETFQDLIDAGIVRGQKDVPDAPEENDVVSLVGGTSYDESLYVQGIDSVLADDSDYSLDVYGDFGSLILGAGDDDVSVYASRLGSEGASLIDGGAGNDYLETYRDDDTLSGGEGDDRLYSYGDGTDVLQGGAGADTLYAFGDGDDILYGGAGDDRLHAFGGSTGVTMDGGEGDDYVRVQTTDNVSLVGGEGIDTLDLSGIYSSGSDFSDFEVIIAGSGNDTFDSSEYSGRSLINGGDGDDYFVYTDEGMPAIDGDSGLDILDFSAISTGLDFSVDSDDDIANIEKFIGGSGDDTLTSSSTYLIGGDGADTIVGGNLDQFILGGQDGSDLLVGGAGDDTIDGGAVGSTSYFGDDTMTGGEGADVFHFDFSAQTNHIQTGMNMVTIGGYFTSGPTGAYIPTDFSTTFSISSTTTAVNVYDHGVYSITDFTVGEDILVLTDRSGANEINNGNTDVFPAISVVDGGLGGDLVINVGGNLQISLDGIGDGSLLNFSDLIAEGIASIGTSFSTPSSNTDGYFLDGGEGNDLIVGAKGDGGDTLLGGEGDDTIQGISKDASIDGGAGDDELYFVGGRVDYIEGGEGEDSLFAMEAITESDLYYGELSGIEAVYLDHDGDYNDEVEFDYNTEDMMIVVGGGSDIVYLGDGSDTLSVDADDFDTSDRFDGGSGEDALLINVDSTGDSISSIAYDDFEEIYLSGLGSDFEVEVTGNDAEVVDASGFSGDVHVAASSAYGSMLIQGGAGNDTLESGSGWDELHGGAGDDSLSGGGSQDLFVFGSGNDTFNGGSDEDVLALGDGSTTFNLDNSSSGFAELSAGTDFGQLSNVEILDLGAGDDVMNLNGTNQSYTVMGSAGDDVINVDVSELSNYTLYGDADRFIEGSSGADTLLAGYDTDDIIYGGELNDTLYGGGGDDTLDGGLLGANALPTTMSPVDYLTGGEGSDVFLFDVHLTSSSTSSSSFWVHTVFDRGTSYITDFEIGEDVVMLSSHGDPYYPELYDMDFGNLYVTDNGYDVVLNLDNKLTIVIEGIGDGTYSTHSDLTEAGILDFTAYYTPSADDVADTGDDVLMLSGGTTESTQINDVFQFDELVTDDNDYDIDLLSGFGVVSMGSGVDRVTDYNTDTDSIIYGGGVGVSDGADTLESAGGGDTLVGGSGSDVFDFIDTYGGTAPAELAALVDFGTDSAADILELELYWQSTYAGSPTSSYVFSTGALHDYGQVNILNFGVEDTLAFMNSGTDASPGGASAFDAGMTGLGILNVEESVDGNDVHIEFTVGAQSLLIVLEDIGTTGVYDSLDALESQGYGISFVVDV